MLLVFVKLLVKFDTCSYHHGNCDGSDYGFGNLGSEDKDADGIINIC